MRARVAVLVASSLAGLALLVGAAPAAAAEIFNDDFESAGMSAWTLTSSGGGGVVATQSSIVHGGASAARLTATTATGSFAFARKTLSLARADLRVAAWFNVQAEGVSGGNVPLLRLFASDGTRLATVLRQNATADAVYVQHSGAYRGTSGRLALRTWTHVEVAVTAAGTSDAAVELWLDGVSVLRQGATLSPVATVQIGNDVKSQAFSIVVDDVSFEDGPRAPVPSGGDPVLVGAGDIAGCNNPGDEATAALLDQIPGTVFTLGDNVYPTGTRAQYDACYAPSWGRHKDRTRPAPGNHEYDAAGTTGYFEYFGASAGPAGKGYYSYDLGAWHVVVLNSNCAFAGGCEAGSAQEQWLRADLAASSAACTVAMWHHPRFSSGAEHGGSSAVQPFWQALYEAGAEIVLAGHDHHYERFAALDGAGAVDSSFGMRSFVVGSGGFSHRPLGALAPNHVTANTDVFGVLKLTLRSGEYDWQFVPEAGATYTDSGTGSCHGAPPTPPPPPPPPPPPVDADFADGFESGSFSAWSSLVTAGGGSAVVQQALVHDATNAARLKATSTAGSVAYARRSVAATTELTAGGWFNLQGQGASGGNVPLLRLFDGARKRIVSLHRQNQAADQLGIQHSGAFHQVAGKLAPATWTKLAVRVVVDGVASTVEVYLNDTRIYRTVAANLGTAAVASVQVGSEIGAQAFDLVVDDVSATSPAA